MADGRPNPESESPKVERSTGPRATESPKEAVRPPGAQEQKIIGRIDADGDEDRTLADIAGVQPKTPFQQNLDNESARDRTPIVGGEIIRPTAVRADDPRNADGSLNFKAAQERGWLSAMTAANGKRELPAGERQKNVQDIVNAAIATGVPREKIGQHLTSLGINAVSREQAQSTQTAATEARADDPAVTKSLDYVDRLAESVLAGRSQPAALQNYVDYSIKNGVPRDRIEAILSAKGIPITKRPETASEARQKFDPKKPIDGRTYRILSQKFNDVRGRLIREGGRGKLARLEAGGRSIGRIMNGPFAGGDTIEARLAYNQISDLLDEIEGTGT